MAGLFDGLQMLMGRPDPRQQIASALGQAPGQPGSPAGPQLSGGGRRGPTTRRRASSGSPGSSWRGSRRPSAATSNKAPPQPQVYQSPPDLAQMYMALSQHDQASNQFYNGLGLLSAGMYPGRNPNASMKWAQGMQQDPNSQMNSLMQIQQYAQQNQALQAFQRSIPDVAKQNRHDDRTRCGRLGPQGASEVMSKIAGRRTPVLAAARPGWPSNGPEQALIVYMAQANFMDRRRSGVLRRLESSEHRASRHHRKDEGGRSESPISTISPRRSETTTRRSGLSTSSIQPRHAGGRRRNSWARAARCGSVATMDDKGKAACGALQDTDHGDAVLDGSRQELQGRRAHHPVGVDPGRAVSKARWGN